VAKPITYSVPAIAGTGPSSFTHAARSSSDVNRSSEATHTFSNNLR
jgi:hypothetical protein